MIYGVFRAFYESFTRFVYGRRRHVLLILRPCRILAATRHFQSRTGAAVGPSSACVIGEGALCDGNERPAHVDASVCTLLAWTGDVLVLRRARSVRRARAARQVLLGARRRNRDRATF